MTGRYVIGVDVGTSRVKATSMLLDGMKIAANAQRGWTECGAFRNRPSDWIKLVKDVLAELSVLNTEILGCIEPSAIGIAAISPCYIAMNDVTHTISPLLQYDEAFSDGDLDLAGDPELGSRAATAPSPPRGRAYMAAASLGGWVPRSGDSRVVLLPASSWLGHTLVGGVPWFDTATAVEWDTNLDTVVPPDIYLPKRRLRPWQVAGVTNQTALQLYGLPVGVPVAAGSSDSFALALSSGLEEGEHLVYMGTFFSLLRARCNLDRRHIREIDYIPYEWVISQPGGALIERLAASWFMEEPTVSSQIEDFLAEARPKDLDGASGPIIKWPRWQPGVAVAGIPSVKAKGLANDLGSLAFAPFMTFAQSLARYAAQHDVAKVRCTGGLMRQADWIVGYLEKATGVEFDVVHTDNGARGAAILAAMSIENHSVEG